MFNEPVTRTASTLSLSLPLPPSPCLALLLSSEACGSQELESTRIFGSLVSCSAPLQGYLTHTNPPPLRRTLCPGAYGDPRGVGVSYERGTPGSRTLLARFGHARATHYLWPRGGIPKNDYTLDNYRGASLTRNRRRLGPYSKIMPRAIWKS